MKSEFYYKWNNRANPSCNFYNDKLIPLNRSVNKTAINTSQRIVQKKVI